MLAGFAPPYTPSGRSTLLPPPPWHYAGTVLSVAYGAADPAAAASLLPAGFGRATGRCVVHACEWQATTDGTELLDPVQAQYREMIFLVEAERAEGLAVFCPFIYVDQDVALVRGWLQGWPKKFGSVWMTRSYGPAVGGPAAAPRAAGTRIGATLAAKDR
uniref:acetoacetate decarboxylase family protein n=1 Tax=Falsiroseomonas oryzae TaxID=2766473 RepID=UPI0022EA9086